jgi:hypothetical protein
VHRRRDERSVAPWNGNIQAERPGEHRPPARRRNHSFWCAR